MAKRMPAPVQPVSVNPNSAPTEREIKLIRLDELVPGSDKSVLEFLGWVNEIEQQKSRVAKSWLSVEDARQCDTPQKHVAPLRLDVSQAAKRLMEVARRNRLGCFGEDVIVRVAKPLAALIVAAEKLVNDATDSTGIDEFAAAAGWLDRELQDAAKLAGSQMRHRNGQRKPVPDPWQYVTLDQMAARGKEPVLPKGSNWPVGKGWEFRPGEAAFQGEPFAITGKPAVILRRLAEKPGEPVLKSILWDIIDRDRNAEEGCVRDSITKARAILRDVFKLGKNVDPIPNLAKGADAAWKLNENVFRVATKNPR